MYTILVNEDHSLITTKKERIMQRSKNVNSLCFLIKPQLNDLDIQNSTVVFEYITPVSHRYDSITLTPSEEMVDGYLQFVIPFNTTLTTEAGDLLCQLSFLYVDLDADGNSVEQAKKTSIAKIRIVPLAAWSDYIPDSTLTAIDQRILKTEAQLKAMIEMGEMPIEDKADDINYDRDANRIQLMSNGKPIGKEIILKDCEAEVNVDLKDGIPIVDFSVIDGDGTPNTGTSTPSGDKEVVEF